MSSTITTQSVQGHLIEQALEAGRTDVVVLSIQITQYMTLQASLAKITRSF